ncbi:hypothetical protein PGT21_013821 [Puccinia graminis f. sp. tritici]|uniref:Uncharacterized protein n=1 Tax=Puccinia graminis f. sp. tritici TaxID=56615 RepID=A0A5B0N1R6_PUCGR|nr:hypothetical protein PGT21_013821 [Puccinia graminis f. sp. tritici]KAA1088027.1 hypothetical protein PGTUg99_020608 [Puccinia graminis f. sp. tritici]
MDQGGVSGPREDARFAWSRHASDLGSCVPTCSTLEIGHPGSSSPERFAKLFGCFAPPPPEGLNLIANLPSDVKSSRPLANVCLIRTEIRLDLLTVIPFCQQRFFFLLIGRTGAWGATYSRHHASRTILDGAFLSHKRFIIEHLQCL